MPTNVETDCEWEPFSGGIALGKMRVYLDAAGANKSVAAEMFHLDGRLAASLLPPIRLIELVLREAIHQKLSTVYGTTWMFNQNILDARSIEKVSKSNQKARKHVSPNKVISELNLGFWAGLFQKGDESTSSPTQLIKHRETLWIPALSKIFMGPFPQRKATASLILRVSHLRNRVAHHEPILFGVAQPGNVRVERQVKQSPINAYGDLIQLATMLDSTLGDFFLDNFSVIELLENDLSQRALRHAKSHQNLFWI